MRARTSSCLPAAAAHVPLGNYEPDSTVQRVADAGGAVKPTPKGNLRRSKELLEQQGDESGAWRGSVTRH